MARKVNKKQEESKEKEEIVRKKERSKENKLLGKILIVVGIFFLVLILSFVLMKLSKQPRYNGLTFNVIQEGEIIFYQTSFPIIYQGKVADYNIYLRNNPKELKKIPFEGTIDSIGDTVINITEEFDCNGDQVIAVANIINLYNAIGKKIMKDDNASCDAQGRYMYITIQRGEETNVEQVGPSCYNINVNNCEILQGTERFIIEMLVKYNSNINK